MNPTQEQYISTYLVHPSFPRTPPPPKRTLKITKCAKDDDEVKEEPVKEAVQNYTPNQNLPEARKTIYTPPINKFAHNT